MKGLSDGEGDAGFGESVESPGGCFHGVLSGGEAVDRIGSNRVRTGGFDGARRLVFHRHGGFADGVALHVDHCAFEF